MINKSYLIKVCCLKSLPFPGDLKKWELATAILKWLGAQSCVEVIPSVQNNFPSNPRRGSCNGYCYSENRKVYLFIYLFKHLLPLPLYKGSARLLIASVFEKDGMHSRHVFFFFFFVGRHLRFLTLFAFNLLVLNSKPPWAMRKDRVQIFK